MTYPAQLPPNIVFTAVEKGAFDSCSSLFGTTPKTTHNDTRYSTAHADVPRMLARGTVRSGSRTLPAATAAASTPR